MERDIPSRNLTIYLTKEGRSQNSLLISRYHDKFLETSYKRNFPWVDQIAEVSDSTLKDALDTVVLEMITAGNFERCWLAVPEIIDWSRVSGFRYKRGDRAPELSDIHLTTFLESVRDLLGLTMLRLKHRKVFCIGDNEQIINDWSLFKRNNVEIGFGLSPGFDHTNRADVASSLSPFVSIMRPLFLKKLKHAAKQSDSALQSSYLAVATLQISA